MEADGFLIREFAFELRCCAGLVFQNDNPQRRNLIDLNLFTEPKRILLYFVDIVFAIASWGNIDSSCFGFEGSFGVGLRE
jgi:hypothetical protein